MIPLRKHSIPMTLLIVASFASGRSQAQTIAISPAAGSSAPAPASIRATGVAMFSPGHALPTEPVMLVPAGQMDPETATRLIEDLSVMGRIIEKDAANVLESGDSDPASLSRRLRFEDWGAGPSALFSSLGRARPLYVAGYGALFFIRVDFPLLPGAQTPEEATEQEADSVWAQTRRSLFEPERPGVHLAPDADAPQPYSRDRVDTLKVALITTMKHATNIRGLQPGEWLTIVMQGTSPQAGDAATAMAGAGSTLTLRAKKADVDLYAKGQLVQAQFEQCLQVVSHYPQGQAEFVVPAPDSSRESLAQITEDTAVMCRIIDKAIAPSVGTADPPAVYGPYMGSLERRGRTQGLYLDGFGAVFFIEVRFLLVRLAEEQEQPQADSSGDSVWSQTMDELKGVAPKQPDDRVAAYNAQKVETLKSALVRSLGHATNLRVRRPDERIALVIASRGQTGSYVAMGRGRPWTVQLGPSADTASDTLVLSTTKADVDAFAKGSLTLEQFNEKVQVLHSWCNIVQQPINPTGAVRPGRGTPIGTNR